MTRVFLPEFLILESDDALAWLFAEIKNKLHKKQNANLAEESEVVWEWVAGMSRVVSFSLLEFMNKYE